MRKAKLFILNSIILTTTSFVIRAIGMSFNVYISNKIGSEAMGIYGLIMSVYFFAITLSQSGISLATTKIISEEMVHNKLEYKVNATLKSCFIYSICFSTLACLLFCVFSPYICVNYLHNKVQPVTLYILAFTLPFISLSSVFIGYYTAKRNTVYPSCSQFLENIIKVLVTSYFINLFMPQGIDYACVSLAARRINMRG